MSRIPSTGEAIASVADATPDDAKAALDAACAVQEEWAAHPPRQAAAPGRAAPGAACIFEHIYFARPDSTSSGAASIRRGRSSAGRSRASRRRRGRHRHPGARLRRAGGHRLRGGGRHSVRDGPDPQSLRRPHLHRAARRHPPLRRQGEAERAAERARGQARGRRRRLDRPRHDQPQDRQDDPRRRGARGAHAHQLSADDQPLLLRHRHADARRADRVVARRRRDPPLHHGRLARVPERGGHVRLPRRHAARLLRRLLHGSLSGAVRGHRARLGNSCCSKRKTSAEARADGPLRRRPGTSWSSAAASPA